MAPKRTRGSYEKPRRKFPTEVSTPESQQEVQELDNKIHAIRMLSKRWRSAGKIVDAEAAQFHRKVCSEIVAMTRHSFQGYDNPSDNGAAEDLLRMEMNPSFG